MKIKSFFQVVALLSMIMLAVVGCSNKTSSGNSNTDAPAELTYATTSDAAGLSPIDTNDSVSSHVTSQIYETL